MASINFTIGQLLAYHWSFYWRHFILFYKKKKIYKPWHLILIWTALGVGEVLGEGAVDCHTSSRTAAGNRGRERRGGEAGQLHGRARPT